MYVRLNKLQGTSIQEKYTYQINSLFKSTHEIHMVLVTSY